MDGVLSGDTRSMSRLITRVENRDDGWKDAMKRIYPEAGKARVVGVTGSPGAGKSTLTNAITRTLSEKGMSVGVIAVDPSSPFSGGALLGDRLRMRDVATIPGVFIRSMATRGALGGLCQGARDVARILDAYGKDIVLIETVGVGQDEIEVVKTADTVLVVIVPGQGDGIQALKAGIMEIADVYVVNKSDRPGADEVVGDIQAMLDIADHGKEYVPPIQRTSSVSGEGIKELVDTILAHSREGKSRDRWVGEKVREEVLALMEGEILDCLVGKWGENGGLEKAVGEILDRRTDPYTVVDALLPAIREIVEKTGRDTE